MVSILKRKSISAATRGIIWLSNNMRSHQMLTSDVMLNLLLLKLKPDSQLIARNLKSSYSQMNINEKRNVKKILTLIKDPLGLADHFDAEESFMANKLSLEQILKLPYRRYFQDDTLRKIAKHLASDLYGLKSYEDAGGHSINQTLFFVSSANDKDQLLAKIEEIDSSIFNLLNSNLTTNKITFLNDQLHFLLLLNRKLVKFGHYLKLSIFTHDSLQAIVKIKDMTQSNQFLRECYFNLAKEAHQFDVLVTGLKAFEKDNPFILWSLLSLALRPPARASRNYPLFCHQLAETYTDKSFFDDNFVMKLPTDARKHALEFIFRFAEDTSKWDSLVAKILIACRSVDELKMMSASAFDDNMRMLMTILKYGSADSKSTIMDIAKTIYQSRNTKASERLYLDTLISNGNYEEALKVLNASERLPSTFPLKELKVTLMRNMGLLADCEKYAHEVLTEMIAAHIATRSNRLLISIERILFNIEELVFLNETEKVLAATKNPAKPKGYILICAPDVKTYRRFPHLALLELQKKGWSIHSINRGIFSAQDQIDRNLTGIEEQLLSKNDRIDFKNDQNLDVQWTVDWDNKKVLNDTVNYYQGIFERMSIFERRITININQYPSNARFNSLLKQCDTFLTLIKRIIDLSQRTKLPVRIICIDTLAAPYSVFRTFLRHKNLSKCDVGLIHSPIAYENYYSNLKTLASTKMSVGNITKYPLWRIPFLPRSDVFRSFVSQNEWRLEQIRTENMIHITQNRSQSTAESDDRRRVKAHIEAARAQGLPIICALGKVVCDLGMPFDGGPIFNCIEEWIDHLVKFCDQNPVLVIVKPHPHELRAEIGLYLTQKLRDLFPVKLPPNMIFLGHSTYNFHELCEQIDTVVLWNGSSCLESGALRVPTVMLTDFAHYDYPIGHFNPKNIAEYEQQLRLKKEMHDAKRLERISLLATAFIEVMKGQDVAIPYGYVSRPATNIDIWPPEWNLPALSEYLKSGDSNVSKIADIISE